MEKLDLYIKRSEAGHEIKSLEKKTKNRKLYKKKLEPKLQKRKKEIFKKIPTIFKLRAYTSYSDMHKR